MHRKESLPCVSLEETDRQRDDVPLQKIPSAFTFHENIPLEVAADSALTNRLDRVIIVSPVWDRRATANTSTLNGSKRRIKQMALAGRSPQWQTSMSVAICAVLFSKTANSLNVECRRGRYVSMDTFWTFVDGI